MKKTAPLKKSVNAPTNTQGDVGYIDNFVREIAGDEGCKIISCIGRSEVTDERIEQSTKMKIAEIRSVLNHLHSYGLVEYKREKNMQTGWFTYTWRLNPNRALQNFITAKKREYETLKTKLAAGDCAQAYKCSKLCAPVEFEKAVENSFRCLGCRGKLNALDQEEELRRLEQKISTLTTITSATPELATPPKTPGLGEKLTSFNK